MKEMIILDAHDNMILDGSPLSHLTELRKLDIDDNQITDISFIEDIPYLVELDLDGNEITDLTPLRGLNHLRVLDLDENKVTEISILSGLKQLTVLDLHNNQIVDISPLKELTNLIDLDLDDNEISDLYPLQDLTNLEVLDLDGNKITDVFPLKALRNLTDLDLHDNAITDVYHLKNLTNLEILDLSENHIFDFSPIAGIVENLIEYDSDTQTEPPPDLKPVPRYNKPDVNRDNVVDVTDLVLIAANFDDPDFNAIEQMNIYPDVNGDGEINIIDLLIVASEIGSGDAAPTFKKGSVESYYLTSENLTQWIRLAKQLNIEDTNLKNGIVVLEHLLTLLSSDDTLPKVTTLLPNYPNPFNPETWIPFHLAEPAKVSISIYSVNGTLIRKLSLGFLPAGIYIDKTRAAYWNGEDELGESVSSGIYFFTFKAKDYISTRKLVITK